MCTAGACTRTCGDRACCEPVLRVMCGLCSSSSSTRSSSLLLQQQ